MDTRKACGCSKRARCANHIELTDEQGATRKGPQRTSTAEMLATMAATSGLHPYQRPFTIDMPPEKPTGLRRLLRG